MRLRTDRKDKGLYYEDRYPPYEITIPMCLKWFYNERHVRIQLQVDWDVCYRTGQDRTG